MKFKKFIEDSLEEAIQNKKALISIINNTEFVQLSPDDFTIQETPRVFIINFEFKVNYSTSGDINLLFSNISDNFKATLLKNSIEIKK